MSFLDNLKEQLDGRTQAKGAAYFRQKRVSNLQGDAEAVAAEVRGLSLYDVTAFREDDALVVRCTCAFFRSSEYVCKHIWAVLLAAEARGLLKGDGRHPDLFFDIDYEEKFPDEFEEEDHKAEGFGAHHRLRILTHPKAKKKKRPPKVKPTPEWQKRLKALEGDLTRTEGVYRALSPWSAGRQILYLVEVPDALKNGALTLAVAYRERKQNGEWGKPKLEGLDLGRIPEFPEPADRKILSLLSGAEVVHGNYDWGFYRSRSSCRFTLEPELAELALPLMCASGRCFLRRQPDAPLQPLTWDEGAPWSFGLRIASPAQQAGFRVTGVLRRGDETTDLGDPVLVTPGLAIWPDHISRLALESSFKWVAHFRQRPVLEFPKEKSGDWLQQFLRLPDLPRLEFPDELPIREVQGTPRPRLRIQPIKDHWRANTAVEGKLAFDYGEHAVAASEAGSIYRPETHELIRRDPQAEAKAKEILLRSGFAVSKDYGREPRLELNIKQMPRVVSDLLAEGWHVEAEGKLYRQPGKIDIEVTTGVDWFELHGQVKFDDTEVGLPELLAALKKGEKTVVLGDGSLGMLPEDWLRKYGLLAGLGKAEKGHLRFGRNQAGFLDALLTAQPDARCDAGFTKVRAALRDFDGIKAADPPAGFQGELRGYQREGLGWLHFLRSFGFGGCLADDMGLGKTVQILALLDQRRQETDKCGPTIVVVPKSLIFNWKQEAAQFTPKLRLLDHTGVARLKPGDHFNAYDVILTTYGTLRRDALEFKDCQFDYAILDEAQAIKNPKSESAKATRILQADHRLTVTGTPVENHLGELWSLFEFLNPGMLGQASVFNLAGAGARNPEPETRALLSRALRPFLLRRTKEQVAKDLPSKTEQTVYAEMEPAQRKLYDELRDHYRHVLLAKVSRDGIAKSKIQILEALLRLRQAACHPGLIDKQRTSEPSAKLDLLLPQLAEVLEEGHKALVFSQFTSMLAILRERLDKDNVVYEYLDGKTRNRGAKVERFQNDPACKLFLISLKAGGVGLNLTAAEYVFLLDPWWNPAVEAQAIDRTHRIGQKSAVFAYRLIAKDTVEEKVLELQSHKRALADAILSADNSLIRTLGREDLELLLS